MAHRTITDIAFSWGFQNSTHFSRRFKDEFGLSPHEFRNEACLTAQDGTRMAQDVRTRAANHYRSAIIAAKDGAERISIQ